MTEDVNNNPFPESPGDEPTMVCPECGRELPFHNPGCRRGGPGNE